MRRLLTFILLNLIVLSSFACDDSSINIVSQTTNPDGSITYVLDLEFDLGGLDPTHYGFTLEFLSSQNTPSVVAGGFDATLDNTDLSSGNISAMTGLIGNDVNSVASDGDWVQYDNRTDVLSYEYGGFGGAASNDYTVTLSVTVMGCVESINFDSNTNAGNVACVYNASTGVNCATCSITALALGVQTACDPVTNTYTQQVIVTYTNEPGTGTLAVNGQSFAITASPQTVTLVGLVADGNPVNTTAVFSDDATCTFTANGLFTAPVSCSVTPCAANAGTISN
jgi:hypothetical protein